MNCVDFAARFLEKTQASSEALHTDKLTEPDRVGNASHSSVDDRLLFFAYLSECVQNALSEMQDLRPPQWDRQSSSEIVYGEGDQVRKSPTLEYTPVTFTE